jgi:hypothetical protein
MTDKLSDLYKELSDKDRDNSFEYTTRLQNNIIERQKKKIDWLIEDNEALNLEVKSLKHQLK